MATDGSVLILAGAGSGKTRVLTSRIAWMLEQGQCKPWQVLALTFTNKAAREMKERIAHLVGQRVDEMWVGTFHSVFARILRREAEYLGYDRNFTIYDSDDQLRLVRECMNHLDISTNQLNPKRVRGEISSSKNAMLSVEEFEKSDSGFVHDMISKIYREYTRRLRAANSLDFDDLLLKPIELFETHPERLAVYQDRFRRILIDEYQDTNKAQFKVTGMLGAQHGNVCVVGDDDQSIYGWRGADISNILDFEDHWKNARVFKLEQNYRSTETILEAAHAVVSQNGGRKDKKLWTENGRGEPVTLLSGEDDAMEAALVCDRIRRGHLEGRPYKDFAVLYRTNAQSRALEESLIRNGIRYQIIGGLRFYERREVKDALAYLRLLANPRDEISLLRIINYPRRGVGDTGLAALQSAAQLQNRSLYDQLAFAGSVPGLAKGARQSMLELHSLLETTRTRMAATPLDVAFRDLLSALHIYEALEAEGPEGKPRVENLHELESAVKRYAENSELGLEGFLQEVALVSDIDGMADSDDLVTLMTVHSAKGLEYDTVFVTGMEDGLFPLGNAMGDPEQLEEERRLFYVAATRAKRRLYLCLARFRMRFNGGSGGPSPFLRAIPAELLQQEGGRLGGTGEESFGGRDGHWQGSGATPRNRSLLREDSAVRQRPLGGGLDGSRPQKPARKRTGLPLSGSEVLLNKVSPFRQAPVPPSVEDESQEAEVSDPCELTVNADVMHPTYGPGIIIHRVGFDENMKLTVRFKSVGVKKLVARFARLRVL